jgi:hypothetical protein
LARTLSFQQSVLQLVGRLPWIPALFGTALA